MKMFMQLKLNWIRFFSFNWKRASPGTHQINCLAVGFLKFKKNNSFHKLKSANY